MRYTTTKERVHMEIYNTKMCTNSFDYYCHTSRLNPIRQK